MTANDTLRRSASDPETERDVASLAREAVTTGTPLLRRGVETGAVPAILGGTSLLAGLRVLRGGKRRRGLIRLVVGAGLLVAAVVQRRARSRRGGTAVEGEPSHDADAVATADDAGDDASASDTDSAAADADVVVDAAAVDRLGGAAFDRQSREVPAPQRAFNQGFLAHSTEAFWGIRDEDGSVLVSQDFDAVDGRDGVRYVASSEIGDDVRELPIPDAVLGHWDEVFGGGTAVTGGDEILFVTTDDLAADDLLWVVPAALAPEPVR